ncbi:MAG: hypothetical protein ACIAS6_00880 [Phycisphaerales bacterium JB060]
MPSAPRQPAATMRERVLRTVWMDAALPGVVRRAMRWKVFAGLVVALLAGVLMLGGLPRTQPYRVYAATMFLLAGAMAVGGRAHLVAAATLRRAAAHDHLLCPACTYDLRALDATGTCPECGRAYEHAAVRRQWVDAARRLKRK